MITDERWQDLFDEQREKYELAAGLDNKMYIAVCEAYESKTEDEGDTPSPQT